MTPGYPARLLEQTETLIATDPRRPRQVNLRRAVSASYYALFHFLIDQACRSAFGAGTAQRPLREVLARGFVHGDMRDVSRTFAGGSLPAWITNIAPKLVILPELKSLAETFAKLQEARHRADYDPSRPFTRYEAALLVASAHDAIEGCPAVASDDATRLYLAGLLCWKVLRQR